MKNKTNYDYPPYFYLKKVLETFPKAGFTYLLLWENKDYSYKLHLQKQQIRDNYLMHYGRFHHDLTLLAKLGFLTFEEEGTDIYIVLKQNQEYDFKGYCPC